MAWNNFKGKEIQYQKDPNGDCAFPVVDVIDALVKPANAQKYWSVLKTRLIADGNDLTTKCGQLELIATDGATYKTDILNLTDLLDLLRGIKTITSSEIKAFEDWANAVVSGKRCYVLKHKDISILEIEIGDTGEISSIGKIFDIEHLPVGTSDGKVCNVRELRDWWHARSIPASREGLKDFLESIGLYFPQELLDKSLGLSLSDQYWICPRSESLMWSNVNFFQNEFSEDVGNILFGREDVGSHKNINLLSPDNTTDGILRKKWKIIDGKRYLIKGGSAPMRQEPANEILASRICKRLDIPYVNYEAIKIEGKFYSLCEDSITAHTELVPAWRIKKLIKKDNSMSDYESFIAKCESLGIPDVRLRIDQMLTLDFIIVNVDRHYNNFGLIRNAETLEWLGVAPIYDSGTSMWCRELDEIYPASLQIESKPFRSRHSNQIELVKNFSWLSFDTLDGIESEFAGILKQTTNLSETMVKRNKRLCLALARRIKLLKDIVGK
ncbi:MAG: excisionase [Christensenellaceae bacterium]|jgi:hypothetical protein|nr:excisionase [Christensenellaceae bacterium]